MSHHYSGPDFGFPHGDPRLDLIDLYALPMPGNANESIFIMNVRPGVGISPSGPTRIDPFSPEAIYELKIDTDGDAVANIAYRVRFTPSAGGAQAATLYRVEGADAAGTGEGGHVIFSHAPVSTGGDALVTDAGDYRFFAGRRSDRFLFDTEGALDNRGSRELNSSSTRTYAVSSWKFQTQRWDRGKSACGIARSTARVETGFRPTEGRCPRRRSSFQVSTEVTISGENQ